jgi:hypothetical protein
MTKQRDPIQGEFFNTDSITTTADEVVREAVQNSLDAIADGTVRVRLYVSGDAGALPPPEAERYFAGLWEHAQACGADEHLKDQSCRFVVVEDFGTTGLTGDETAYEEPSPDGHNDFFYFFRAEGKSGKSGADRGRWGVGKYVFPKASKVNSFFAMTMRANGSGFPGPLVMGQAVMKNHKAEGKNWEPDGWWAVIDEEEVPVPARDAEVIKDFRDTWEVQRIDEPGLTVVIPYVDDDLNEAQLRRSVIRDYFIAILAKTLTVDIVASGNESCQINADTLDEVIETLEPAERNEVRRNADLTRWAFNASPADVVMTQTPTGPPSWQTELITDHARQQIRTALDAGQSVVVRVPVNIVTTPEGASSASSFDVLLRPEATHRGTPLFVREGIIVSEVRSRMLPGVRAIVLIQPGAMADLLGDAEGPAHTNWSEKTGGFKGKYKYGGTWLTFIRQAPGRILDIVRGSDDEEDLTLGAEFFSVPSDTDEKNATGGPEVGGDTTQPPSPPSPGSPQRIRITKRQGGGFTVRLTDAGADITRVEVLAAYDRSRGNPFAKWSRDDFDISDLDVQVVGGTVIEQEDNHLVAGVTDPGQFALRVDGFDVNRDVRVMAREGTEA